MRSRKFLIAALCLTVAVSALSGCNRSPQPQGFTMPPAAVVIAPVVTADVPIYLDEIGKTVAKESVTIQPQVSGKLDVRYFADGADVKAGQKLFTIDARPFQALVDSAQRSSSRRRRSGRSHGSISIATRICCRPRLCPNRIMTRRRTPSRLGKPTSKRRSAAGNREIESQLLHDRVAHRRAGRIATGRSRKRGDG